MIGEIKNLHYGQMIDIHTGKVFDLKDLPKKMAVTVITVNREEKVALVEGSFSNPNGSVSVVQGWMPFSALSIPENGVKNS